MEVETLVPLKVQAENKLYIFQKSYSYEWD